MNFGTCQTCREFTNLERHVCPPRFLVWCEDYHSEDEEGGAVYAHSPSAAAEQWADENNSDLDYHPASGCRLRVTDADGEVLWFEVSGTETISWHSRQTAEGGGR